MLRKMLENTSKSRPPIKTALIIPTRNASRYLDKLLPALKMQSLQPDTFFVIDSQSQDDTVQKCLDAGAQVKVILAEEFNHGGTRRLASECVDAEVLIYMTQDAIPVNEHSLFNLQEALLTSAKIGCAYGRQLPHVDAGPVGAHARQFNYTDKSIIKTLGDAPKMGIKTCFSSDSFSAYRKSALQAIGGFPENVIGSEDAYVAGKMLLAGWAVHYEANAQVYHSHDYSLLAEFKRYFDIGVFYGREAWIRQSFGSAGGEGVRFVCSEISTLLRKGAVVELLKVPVRMALKVSGYRLGKLEHWLPNTIKRRISMFSGYWK